jgi:hypothetical protein
MNFKGSGFLPLPSQPHKPTKLSIGVCMQEQKFTLAQGWSALLIFLDSLGANFYDRISYHCGEVGVLIANLNIDTECYQEWIDCFERKYGKEQSQCSPLSLEDLLSLSIDFLSYYRHQLGFPIDPLLDLVNVIKANPAQEPVAATLWTQAFYDRVAQGEFWRREDQSPKINDFLGSLNGRTIVTYDEAASLATYFLRRVSLDLIQKVPSTRDRVISLLSIVEGGDPATPSIWMECCIKTRCIPFNPQNKLSLEEAFAITISFTAHHSYYFGFKLFELMALLNSMRSQPHLHEKEWKIWQEELRDLEGGICERFL